MMIVQVGAYPPPIGGISIYIKRMKETMDHQGIPNQIWDYNAIKKTQPNVIHMNFLTVPFHAATRKDVDLIHYNICGMPSKHYIAFFNRHFFRKRKKIITLHGDSTQLFKKKKNTFQLKTLNSFDAIICVKQHDKKYLQDHGITTRVEEIPPFIPPFPNKEDAQKIDPSIFQFIESHQPVIASNASIIAFHKGEDLYGIDMCIEACAQLKKTYPHIGFIFVLPEIGNLDYYEELCSRIKEKEIEENFLFYHESCEFYPILMKCDVFVRPTNTDGDAVSLREALFFHIPSVASDSVPRPKGTVLFTNRNNKDYYDKLQSTITTHAQHIQKLKEFPRENNAEKVIQLYQKIINTSNIKK